MVDHLVFFAVREGASQGEIKDLVSSIRALRDDVPSTVSNSARMYRMNLKILNPQNAAMMPSTMKMNRPQVR